MSRRRTNRSSPNADLRESILKHFQTLRVPLSAAELDAAIAQAEKERWSPLEFLGRLIGPLADLRRQRSIERKIREARFREPKTLAAFDWLFNEKAIDRRQIESLAAGEFIRRGDNLVLAGQSGVGKSHLLNALGRTACEKGFTVQFTRVVDMINTLTTAQINGTLEKKLRHYITPQLLLLDELGYLPIDKRGADLLFQVVAARYESGSIVISTNRAFRDWGAIFDVDNTLATAMIDRLMHHGEAIIIRGDSYRMKDKPTE